MPEVEILAVAKIGPKRQITLPRDVAKLLNVKEGDRVVFLLRNGEIILKNAKSLGCAGG